MTSADSETATRSGRAFVSLGLFIIDEFSFADVAGNPTGDTRSPEIGGGGTYASVGARIWLPPRDLGMIVDAGVDFPPHIRAALEGFGEDMWYFRTQLGHSMTRAINKYTGEHRDFEYLTPRIRLTPRDLVGTSLADPRAIHFICSPQRAHVIVGELRELGWQSTTIYEPIPFRCVPEELPALLEVLPFIDVLSPNAEEALSLLSIPVPVTQEKVEQAATWFIGAGVGRQSEGTVVIRSGEMGSYILSRQRVGEWVQAFWQDQSKVIDVTGAGNSFLGGLAAGMVLAHGDVYKGVLYGTVSASFVIEQSGLPHLAQPFPDDPDKERWNGESPWERLERLRSLSKRA